MMQNNVHLILQFSILMIAVYYFSKVDKVWLKRAVIAFGIYSLSFVLKYFLPWKYVLMGIGLFAILAAFIFSWIEVSRSSTIEAKDKIGIKIFLLPVIIALLLLFFKPLLLLLNLPLVIVSLVILLYYTFKYQNSDYLTQELAVMNLFGIEFVLILVKGFYKLMS